MTSMGMGLTVKDFQRVTVEPQGVLLGLIAQLIILSETFESQIFLMKYLSFPPSVLRS